MPLIAAKMTAMTNLPIPTIHYHQQRTSTIYQRKPIGVKPDQMLGIE
jgi:hypothetical protein